MKIFHRKFTALNLQWFLLQGAHPRDTHHHRQILLQI